jgi:hypothetical protein
MGMDSTPKRLPGALEIPEFTRTEEVFTINLRVFMPYGSFWPLGSRELAGSCSSALVVRSRRAFSA